MKKKLFLIKEFERRQIKNVGKLEKVCTRKNKYKVKFKFSTENYYKETIR